MEITFDRVQEIVINKKQFYSNGKKAHITIEIKTHSGELFDVCCNFSADKRIEVKQL